MLYLSEQDVLTLLTMPACIDLVESAFRMLGDGTAINHLRRRIVMPNGATLAYMAAATPRYFGTKVYSVHPKGGMHFQVLIFRTEDAMPLATIEANHMGQIRTGAASGVATKYMARADASVMAVIGSGFQAETQIAAVAAVRKLTDVRVWSRNAARREAFAVRCSEKLGLNIRATSSGSGSCGRCADRHHRHLCEESGDRTGVGVSRRPYQCDRREPSQQSRAADFAVLRIWRLRYFVLN